jgi:hypothetical protein
MVYNLPYHCDFRSISTVIDVSSEVKGYSHKIKAYKIK